MSSINETPSPVPSTQHDLAARDLVAQLRTRLSAVPGYGFLPPAKRRKLQPSANVSDRFVESVATTADTNLSLAPSASAPRVMSSAQLREGLAFANAYLRAADELQVLVRGLRETALARRAEIGEHALRLYRVSQAMNRTADPEMLVPEVVTMRRTLGRGRKRAQAVETPEEIPEVTPAPVK